MQRGEGTSTRSPNCVSGVVLGRGGTVLLRKKRGIRGIFLAREKNGHPGKKTNREQGRDEFEQEGGEEGSNRALGVGARPRSPDY